MVGDGVGCIITGTRSGVLSWWSQPAYTPQGWPLIELPCLVISDHFEQEKERTSVHG